MQFDTEARLLRASNEDSERSGQPRTSARDHPRHASAEKVLPGRYTAPPTHGARHMHHEPHTAQTTIPTASNIELAGKDQVCQILGLSARTLEGLIRDGLFPPGKRLGRFIYWRKQVVLAWLDDQFAEQATWTPARRAKP